MSAMFWVVKEFGLYVRSISEKGDTTLQVPYQSGARRFTTRESARAAAKLMRAHDRAATVVRVGAPFDAERRVVVERAKAVVKEHEHTAAYEFTWGELERSVWALEEAERQASRST